MNLQHHTSIKVLISTISLSALGLLHCESDANSDPPSSAGKGGASGANGSGGNSGSATAGQAQGGLGGRVSHGGNESGGAGSEDAGRGGASPDASGGVGGDGIAGNAGAGGEGGAWPDLALHSILIGSFAPLPAYAAAPLSGQAILYRTLWGDTGVSIQITGLTASTAYASHVHNQPCAVLAGTHYLIDPTAPAGESNEIWLPLTSDTSGVGFTQVLVDGHSARGDALSIVVHDPAAANAKMACADLTVGSSGELVAKGTFAAFAAAEAVDQTISGSVQVTRKSAGTDITLDVSGLDATAAYACHVHAFPCGVTTAGGHYKLDPTNAATDQANELWPALGSTNDGTATGLSSFVHRARLDAQSVVIHRSVSGSAPKVACANLNVDKYPDVALAGTSQLLPAATPDYTTLSATADLVRSLDGMTSLHVAAAGLKAGTTYATHLHNRPCSVQSGGGHYLRDKNAAAGETNEIWLPLTTGAGGSVDATAKFQHTAAADARSVVIHDPNSAPANARLACIDLK